MSKKNIYISAVGTRDPYWKIENNKYIYYNELCKTSYKPEEVLKGPILEFLDIIERERKIDFACLLPTAEGEKVKDATVRGGEKLVEILKEKGIPAKCYPWDGSKYDPSDHLDSLQAVRIFLEEVMKEYLDENYIINISPGTPQIGGAFLLLANSGFILADIYQIKKDEGIKKVEVESIFEEETKKIAFELYKNYSFKAAAYY
jgi:DNA-binding phage protein